MSLVSVSLWVSKTYAIETANSMLSTTSRVHNQSIAYITEEVAIVNHGPTSFDVIEEVTT